MKHRQGQQVPTLNNPFLTALYQQHVLRLTTYVSGRVRSREDAEDIVLEVFLAALKQPELASLSGEKQLAWLQRVAYYKSIDHQRRIMQRRAVPLEEAEGVLVTDEDQSPENLALRSEEEMLLRERLSRLPEHYQIVLQLRFVNGLHSPEIASLLHKSEGAIRMSLSRALNTLRDIYKE
ncbi:MAG TPA: RNA polymerase sigma factor [Ktedonobacteraceae bacterium]